MKGCCVNICKGLKKSEKQLNRHCHAAEPRGRDCEAVEGKSAGGVSPRAGGGGGGNF